MRKCTNSCSRLIKSSASLIEITHLRMVVAQLFEVTVAADGSELSSKRVSKLSRRYHRHKKQLRQSDMMAEGLFDVWVCPKCSYENQDYQRCMGPDCDTVRPGGQFDTSAKFSLSTQPPSSGCRSTISVAMNHPAAAARRSKKPPPPQRESPGRAAKTNAAANITEMCSVRGHLLPHPPRDFTPTPLAPRKSAAAVDDSIGVAAGEDSSRHGGGGSCCHPCVGGIGYFIG